MLAVYKNNKNLAKKDISGELKPFFWLGDTAWLLAQKLTADEANVYFADRAEKNFNVIQTVLVHNMNVEEPDGKITAVLDNDFSKICSYSGYWEKIDTLVEMVAGYGLYMGLLPVWGSMVKKGYLNADNAESYGKYLADRYGQHENVIWILGGDIRGETGFDVWNILGNTIKKYAPEQLVTFHPFGRTSSAMWFNDCGWLDFNMFQSGHRRYDQSSLGFWDDNNVSEDFYGEDNWRYVRRELARTPLKPVLDGEPSYENIPQGLHDFSQPLWKAKDVRRYAYWSVFEGACGHTYGDNAIMQFYRENDKDAGYNVKTCWREALNDPGSAQMGYLYNLMTSVNFQDGKHNDNLINNGGFTKYDRITAFSGKDFALIYNYSGRSFELNLEALEFKPVSARWYDPASGVFLDKETAFSDVIDVPKNSSGESDMILVLK